MAAERWKTLEVNHERPDLSTTAVRLNSLGSLFFFTKFVLGRDRLSTLHRRICRSLETDNLRLVMEMPMGTFKTTIGAESLPIWWSLPFTAKDEFMMRELGYSDSWIRWMKRAHRQNSRTLITHAIFDNAVKFGHLVDQHYQSNPMFRMIFEDIVPDSKSTWNDKSKFHVRLNDGIARAEGTYEYRGVGQQLQSLHFDGAVNDDSVGLDAQRNMLRGDGSIMEEVIHWWQQVATRMDTPNEGVIRHLVIGNRWGHADLNSWIQKHMPDYKFETHSIDGGCCPDHTEGESIFPEEFPLERIAELERTLPAYDMCHWYRNRTMLPEEVIFREEWLRFYTYKPSHPELDYADPRNALLIEHPAEDGEAIEDIPAGVLNIRILIDIAHQKKQKRARHVILVVGLDRESDRIYMLDLWAKKTQYSELVDKIYHYAQKWDQHEIWLETVAAQDILKFHIEERNAREIYPLRVNELPYDNSQNAKANRIEALEPLFRNAIFWCHRSHIEFLNEYRTYPATPTVDVLDTLGYAPGTFDMLRSSSAREIYERAHQRFASRRTGVTGY